jgi:threonine aldolase
MMQTIDLRSDTVTSPGPGMREAIANAAVGDDVYGEDPTVSKLEQMAAERVGKEFGLFVPSGTMANQIAIRCSTTPGDQVLAGQHAHLLRYEAGAAAGLWGVQITSLGRGGFFGADDVSRAIPDSDVHNAPATVVSLENTHNVSGGRVWPEDQLRGVVQMAQERGLRVHIDGARIFNAACAAKTSAASLAAGADTVAFCLSKGLGAPVGSVVCGPKSLSAAMRRTRKMLGGGMRQAGIIAAAGIYALEHHVDRLEEDHRNARRLAEGLAEIGLELVAAPETNIVVFQVPEGRSSSVPDARTFSARAREAALLINGIGGRVLRAVTHLDISADEIDDALRRIKGIL